MSAQEEGAAPPATSSNKSPKKSKPKKAGLKKARKQKMMFPAEELHRKLIGINKKKAVEPQAAIFLTAVDLYLAHELIELAGNHAVSRGSDTITEQDVRAIIAADDELHHLFHDLAET